MFVDTFDLLLCSFFKVWKFEEVVDGTQASLSIDVLELLIVCRFVCIDNLNLYVKNKKRNYL